MSGVKRNRTVRADLLWLEQVLGSWPAGISPPRLELSISEEGRRRLAVFMADGLRRPVVGAGDSFPAAIRAMRDDFEKLARSKRGGRR